MDTRNVIAKLNVAAFAFIALCAMLLFTVVVPYNGTTSVLTYVLKLFIIVLPGAGLLIFCLLWQANEKLRVEIYGLEPHE